MKYLLLSVLLAGLNVNAQKLKPISTYLANPRLSKEAKYFYKKLPQYQKDHQLFYADRKSETVTFSIMNAVLIDNGELRPFYLYLMNRNLDMVDGSLQLTALLKQYEIIGKKPAVFFQYMLDNPVEKKTYFSKWAEMMTELSELYCANPGKAPDPDCLVNFRKKSMKALPAGNHVMKAMASEFFDLMMIAEALPPILELDRYYYGKTVFISPGQTVKVRFRECRGCASVWKIAATDNAKVFFVKDEYTNPSCVNCIGGNQDHSIFFRLLSNEMTSISFTYFDEVVTIKFIPY